MSKQHVVKAVPAAVSATVAPANSTDNPAYWETMGRDAAIRDTADADALAIARVLLKDAPYDKWIAFGKAFMAGAKPTHRDPEGLLHRVIYKPLADEKITRPISPTSSNARPKVVEAQAKRKAELDELGKMSDAALATESKSGTSTRQAAVYVEMARRVKAKAKDIDKAAREARSKARKALVDVIDTMTVPEMQKALALVSGVVAKRKQA